jgi:hypothetical protein
MPRLRCPHPGCSRVCLSSEVLLAHQRSHQGLLPFACPHPGCNRTFSIRGNMRTHMRLHEPGRSVFHAACPADGCERVFQKERSFKKHVLLKHPELSSLDNLSNSAQRRFSPSGSASSSPSSSPSPPGLFSRLPEPPASSFIAMGSLHQHQHQRNQNLSNLSNLSMAQQSGEDNVIHLPHGLSSQVALPAEGESGRHRSESNAPVRLRMNISDLLN